MTDPESSARLNPSRLSLETYGILKALKIGLVVAILAALISLLVPDQFTSTARVLPKDPKGAGSMGNLMAAAAALGVMGGSDDASSAYVDILNSRWVLENLLNTPFHFHQKTWKFGSDQEHTETLKSYLKARTTSGGVRALDQMIEVQKDLKSGLISVAVTSESPELSQQIAKKCISLLEEFLIQHAQTQAGAKVAFVTQRLADAKNELLVSENRMNEFAASNRNYQTSLEPSVRLKGARIEAELSIARQLVSTLTMSREQALLNQKDDTPIINVLDAGELPDEKSKPKRGILVLGFFALATLATMGWHNRAWIKQRLTEQK